MLDALSRSRAPLRLAAALLLALLAGGTAEAGDPAAPSEDAPPKIYDEEIPVRHDGITFVIDASAPDLVRLKEDMCRSIASLTPAFDVRIHVLAATARSWRERPVAADAAGKAAAIAFVRAIEPAPACGAVVFLGGRESEKEGAALLRAQRDASLLAALEDQYQTLAAGESPRRRSKLAAARGALLALRPDKSADAGPALEIVRGVRSRAAAPLLLAALVRANGGDSWASDATGALAHALERLTGEPCSLGSGGTEYATDVHDRAVERARLWLAREEMDLRKPGATVDLARMQPERLATVASALLDDVERSVLPLDISGRHIQGSDHAIGVARLELAIGILVCEDALAEGAVSEEDLSPALVPALLEAAREPAHLASAAAVLALLRRSGQAGALERILAGEEGHPAERVAAAIALRAAGEPLPAALLESLARDGRPREVRLAAILLLAMARERDAARAAVRALAKGPAWEVRRAAAAALARLDPAAGTEALAALLADTAERDRARDVLALLAGLAAQGRLAARDAIGDRLEALLRDEACDPARAYDAAEALGRVAGKSFGTEAEGRLAAKAALTWWRERIRAEDAPPPDKR